MSRQGPGVTSPFKKSLAGGSAGLAGSSGSGGPNGRWGGPGSRVDSLPEHEVRHYLCIMLLSENNITNLNISIT